MNLIWLDDFMALAATGNFSRAAEERHSSQPAFSRRIRALEEWLGADLFDRDSQPARLTEVGHWFVGIAQDLMLRVTRIPEDARRISEASSITLRMACTHALSTTFWPRWIRSLETRITLGPTQLRSDVLERCELLMAQGKVQFVLSHAHPEVPGELDREPHRSIRVGEDLLIAVSAADADGRPRHALARAAGSRVPVLLYTDESGLGRIMRTLIRQKLDALAGPVAFTAHLSSLLRAMALEGRGVAWLPLTLVAEDLDQGRLARAADDDWNVPLEIRLYRDLEPIGRTAEDFWRVAADE